MNLTPQEQKVLNFALEYLSDNCDEITAEYVDIPLDDLRIEIKKLQEKLKQ